MTKNNQEYEMLSCSLKLKPILENNSRIYKS